jgi:hypothetical protein
LEASIMTAVFLLYDQHMPTHIARPTIVEAAGNLPKRIEEYAKLNRYHVKMLAYFLEKLRSTPDGDGTLLDHAVVLYGSNMGNSNQHLHYDVPHILAGGASGRLKGGRHLAFPSRTVPTGNLLVSIMDLFDVRQESLGDSTGRLTGLV